MNTNNFWGFFEGEASANLGLRKNSFQFIFEFLDKQNRPVFILETGCARNENTKNGDGHSTILFDKYVSQWPGSLMLSVDIDPIATDFCKSQVSSATRVHTGDSVLFLHHLAKNPPTNFVFLDVLYLDSLDVSFQNPHVSALHHMKEFIAISKLIGPETLVVIDDTPLEAKFTLAQGKINFITEPQISGKALYIANYANHLGIKPIFVGYQTGWIGF